ncbi:MAG: septum formation protein Maf [Muribaculaceae bacterium]|nr:septum formation protein Maf [Muribaculaceae bacterium]
MNPFPNISFHINRLKTLFMDLNKYHILLASKSPRRREILKLLNIPFSVVNIDGLDESFPSDMKPEKVSQFIADKKADEFLKRIGDDEVIITADTVVICDDKILGKPKDKKEAHEMLRFLSGKTHKVTTGVTIATRYKRISFSSESLVTFAELTDEEIEYYIDVFHPFDKAGAYGIQEWIGAVAVAEIDGSFYNVMGLPVHRLYQELKKF